MSNNLSNQSKKNGKNLSLSEEIKELSKNRSAEEAAAHINNIYNVGLASIRGTKTFYDFLNTRNRVAICDGSACLVSNKQNKLKQELLKYFGEDEITEVTCLGLCHKNSAFMYNGKAYSTDNPEEIKDIIRYNIDSKITFPVYTTLKKPILTKPWRGISKQFDILLDYLKNTDTIIDELERSKLRGRGGAGFPFHKKVRSCKEAKSDKKYIICNADEGDSGAYSDMYLMNEHPSKVLFGMVATALAVGADEGIVYIRGEYPSSITSMRKEIGKLYARGYLGENVFNSKRRLHFKVVTGEGAYICGEETSLLNSAEGIRPEVRVRPPFPGVKGLFNHPTVVSNVETFANLFHILYKGGGKFSKIGTEKSTGTKLLSLDAGFNKPGIYEVEMGTPLRDLIKGEAKGFDRKAKAIQVGGPLGGVIPIEYLIKLTIDFESFEENGFLLGHAGVISLPVSTIFAEYVKHLFEFAAKESCGKCSPCRLGTIRGYELFDKALNEDYLIDFDLFTDLLETMKNTSLCALGSGITLPIYNIMRHFGIELKPYFKGYRQM
ncbi:MAG: NAD(P)H-dependent oxidoreductase subunit E [Bacteroidales bacterium]|nr:NAD(P)H-dependent oxidoreductase subunit E [Bacteroidales bacterium]